MFCKIKALIGTKSGKILLSFENHGTLSRHPKSMAQPLGQGASYSLCLRTQLELAALS